MTTYDYYQQPRLVTEINSAGIQRTTTVTYDNAGRAIDTSLTGSVGTAIQKRRNIYDHASGNLIRTQTLDGAGAVVAEIVRTYDSLGQLTSYTDADGNTSTTTYDLLGRVATMNDGKGTRTFTYDGGTERRALPTAVTDSQAGTFSATYDADGGLASETWPNGIVVARTYNEVGSPISHSYSRPGCGQPDCTIFVENSGYTIHGQRQWASGTLGDRTYTYDTSNRLIQAQETISGTCTSRVYDFDEASNRTSQQTYIAATGTPCQTTTATTTQTWTYDNAGRASSAGYVYDALVVLC